MDTPDIREPEQKRTRATIMRLSEMIDLIGLRTYIIKRTPKGKSAHHDPWGYTKAALAEYAPSTDPARVIHLFEEAGCENELQAMRWLLTHDEHVP